MKENILDQSMKTMIKNTLIILIAIALFNKLVAIDPSKQLIALAQGGALNEERLGVLLRQGADIHTEDEQVLREAVYAGNEPEVNLLLEMGAMPDEQMLAHAVTENQGPIIRILLSWAYERVYQGHSESFDFRFLQSLLRYAEQRGLQDSIDAIMFSTFYNYFKKKQAATSTATEVPTPIYVYQIYAVVRDERNRPIEVKRSSGAYRIFEQSTLEELLAKYREDIATIIRLQDHIEQLHEQLALEKKESTKELLTSRIYELSRQVYQLQSSSQVLKIKDSLYIKDPTGGGVLLPEPIAHNYRQYLKQLLQWENLLEAVGGTTPHPFLHDDKRSEIEIFLRKILKWNHGRKLPNKLQISINNIITQDPMGPKDIIVSQDVALAIVVMVLYETPDQARIFLSDLAATQKDLITNKTVGLYNLDILKNALEEQLLEQQRSIAVSPMSTIESSSSLERD